MRSRIFVPALAAVVAAIAIVPFLGARSVWFDEGVSLGYAALPLDRLWGAVQHADASFVVYYGLLDLWRVFGTSDVAARSLSALAVVAAVVVAYAAARALFGERTATIAAFVFALTPFVAGEGADARPYALLLLVTTCATWTFVRAVERPTAVRLAWYVVAAAAAVWVHAFAALLLVAHAVSLVFVGRRSDGVARWLVTYACVAAASAPVAWVLFVARDARQLYWLQRPVPSDAWAMLAGFDGSQIAAGVGLVLAVWAIARAPAASRAQTFAATCWFALPIALAYAISLVGQPMFLPRYLTGSLFPLTLLIAAGIARLPGRALAPLAALGLIAIFVRVDLVQMRTSSEDYRAAVAFAEHDAGGGVLTYPPGGVYAVRQEAPAGVRPAVVYPPAGWNYWDERTDRAPAPDARTGAEPLDAIVRSFNRDEFERWRRGTALRDDRERVVAQLPGVVVLRLTR